MRAITVIAKLIAILLLVGIFVIACAFFWLPVSLIENTVEQDRPVAFFHIIKVEGNVDVDVSVGPTPSLKVEAKENILPLIETSVENEMLSIRVKKDPSISQDRDNGPQRVHITVPTLTHFYQSGISRADIRDLRGGFSIYTIGGSYISASGNVDTLEVQAIGVSVLDLDKLKARKATVNAEGVVLTYLNVTEVLESSFKGISWVKHLGTPYRGSISGSGIGTLKPSTSN